MGARLKSIISPIRWSLLLKPATVALAWLILPWWGSLAVAAYCYLVPLFRARPLFAPFLVLLLLGFLAPQGVFQAAYGAIVFTLILGIKDLIIVNRRPAYELLVFLLAFAGFLVLFNIFPAWSVTTAFFALALAVVLWLWLVLADPERPPKAPVLQPALAALLLFEAGAVIFFLPLSFFSQAALLFFGSALLFEAVAVPESFRTKHFLIWGGTYAAITFLVVFLASWKV